MGDHVVLHQTDELGPATGSQDSSIIRNRSAVFLLGIIEICIGIGIIAVEIGALVMFREPTTPGYPVEYGGIWTGLFAIVAGIVQLLAGQKTIATRLRRRLFSVGLGTSVVSMIQAAVLFTVTTVNIFITRKIIRERENTPAVEGKSLNGLTLDYLKDLAMLRSVVAIVYFSLALLCLVSAVLGCCNCCGKNRRLGELPPDQVVYTSVDGNQVKQIKIYNKSHHIKS